MFFAAISNYCVGEVSAYPKQEFSPDIDDPDDVQLEGSCKGKRGNTQSEHIWVELVLQTSMSCSVFYFRPIPDDPRRRRIVVLDPWKALGPPGFSTFEQAFALNFSDDLSLPVSSATLRLISLVSPCLPHHDASEVHTALEPLVPS